METNSAGKNGTRLTSFTKIFYHDWDDHEENLPDIARHSVQRKFNDRYLDFQHVIPDPKPGMKISPMMVDVMFEVVNILDGLNFLFHFQYLKMISSESGWGVYGLSSSIESRMVRYPSAVET